MPPNYFNLIPYKPQKVLVDETAFKWQEGKSFTHQIGSHALIRPSGLSNWPAFLCRRTRLYFLLLYMFFCFFLTLKYLPLFQYSREVKRKTTANPSSMIYEGYCIHSNIFEPEQTEDLDRITQVLHISADFLDNRIVDQVKNWKGPVSLAVLITSEEEYSCTIQKISEIIKKYREVGGNLRVHFISSTGWNQKCTRFHKNSKCKRKSDKNNTFYPVNIARNVARMFSKTQFVLIADFEHMFSERFEEEVRVIAKEQLNAISHKVLVYRIFEIDEDVPEPKTLTDLKQLYDKKKAVVFHSLFYKGAHDMPKLSEWFRDNGTGIFIENLKYTKFNWEPQFVSRNNIPLHDVNFPYTIRDNTVLRWELCRAEYQFDLLKGHFMFHKGIKKSGRTISAKENYENIKRFNSALAKFNRRMNDTYPDSFKKCPKFQA